MSAFYSDYTGLCDEGDVGNFISSNVSLHINPTFSQCNCALLLEKNIDWVHFLVYQDEIDLYSCKLNSFDTISFGHWYVACDDRYGFTSKIISWSNFISYFCYEILHLIEKVSNPIFMISMTH